MSIAPPGAGLRLLSFDGGGIRAVSQALMVREMMHRIEADCELPKPAKVCDYFDMICGSGFGGLLAIMCGILEMTGDQLVEEFVVLCKAVLSQGLDTAQRTAVLENEVKRLIRSYSAEGEDRKMFNEDDTCKTFVCAVASQNAGHPRLFRNYGSRANRSPDCTVWEATLATMAIPSLFAPIVIGKQPLVETFVGGEFGCNNPTGELTREAACVFKDCQICCIINIGSGHAGHLSLSQGLSTLFSSIASDCERVADDMERRFEHASGRFWRLSVDQGLQNQAFDLSNFEILISHTHSYLQGARTTRSIDILLRDITQRPERFRVGRISGKTLGVHTILHRKHCPQPTQYFTGRRAVVQKLDGYFFSDSRSCRIGVLYGIGGSGKTQIGLQFIHENKIRFSDVFVVDASDRFNLENDLKSIATGVSNQPTLDDAFLILRTSKTNWLLFIDNADDPTLDLRPYIKWPHGNILITTRNREVRVHAPNCSIWVNELDLEDAKELLLRGVIVSESQETVKVATEIVQQLGCLALAVNQARAFLAQDICTLSDYLPMYLQNCRKLLEAKFVQSTDDYEHTVYTTWLISFEKLSPAAALLLELLCFMHHDAIPSRLFEDAGENLGEAEQDAVPTALATFLSSLKVADAAWDIDCFHTLIKEILSFSLVEFDPVNRIFSLHPLVQQWAQTHFRHSQKTIHSTQTLICLAVPRGESQEDYSLRMALLPHLRESAKTGLLVHYSLLDPAGLVYSHGGMFRECAEIYERLFSEMQKQFGFENPSTLKCMSHLAHAYFRLGQYRDALKIEKQVLELRKRSLGEEHPDTLTSMANLARTYSTLGQYSDALKLGEQVLEVGKRTLGEEHPSTLMSMGSIARTYSQLGQYREALTLDEQVLMVGKQILGDKHPHTLSNMGNLAGTYCTLGQLRDALKLDEQVLDLRKQTLGEEHPDTLASMNNLGRTYYQLGQYREALNVDEQVLVLSKRIIGEKHPHTLSSMGNLAGSYSILGQHRDAAKLDEQVLDLRKQILGEEHPDTLASMNNLARTYSQLGQHREALKFDEQVLELSKRILGEEHPRTLMSMANLARSYSSLDQLSSALDLEEQALGMRYRILGGEHPHTLGSMANLAGTYSKLGRLSEALNLEEQVLELRKRILGEEHPHTLTSMTNLAGSYSKLGQHRDAVKLDEQVLGLRKQILGEEHPDTLASMNNLARACFQLGQYREALKFDVQVLRLSKRILGEEHPRTLMSMANLARSYSEVGQLSTALDLEEQVLGMRYRILGEEHPHTLMSMANLAGTYSKLGRVREALNLEEQVLPLRKRILGEEHPHTLASMANLARTCFKLNQYRNALKLDEQVLVLSKQILGEEHPDTLMSMANLARTYSQLRRYRDALVLGEQLLALKVRLLGLEHPATIRTSQRIERVRQSMQNKTLKRKPNGVSNFFRHFL
ncbi:hypothetical protein DL96DRAFT_1515757 [Flagelloscypha sp. PMI_526]|nr:hypothetical protein DL96DRAFT_1515757 [Flagelloscypha sp. PMI_526]